MVFFIWFSLKRTLIKKNFVTLSTLRPSLSIFQKMPRKYIRKSARNSWDTNAMALAIAAIESGEMGFKRAAKEFGVPRTTLKRRSKDLNKQAKGTC